MHVTRAGTGPWRVPEENNPFGVFIRTPDVDAIAARVEDLIIRPGGVLRHREWGIYEVGICGPDGMLVRIGWPSRLQPTAFCHFKKRHAFLAYLFLHVFFTIIG